MRRRELLGGLAALSPAAGGLAWAQAGAGTRRVGVIMSYRDGDPEGLTRLAAFRQSLRETGWVEGRNVALDVRWSEGNPERAREQGAELIRLAPDAILVNGTLGLAAIRPMTSAIPIVFVVVTNPVGAGFVRSLSRPGENVTGFSTFEPEIGGKWLEGLKEIAPKLARVGVLYDPGAVGFSALWLKIEELAPAFGVQATAIPGRDPGEIEQGVEAFAPGERGGLIVLPTPINSVQRRRIFALAEAHRLPAMYPFAFHARDGGLIAYGFDAADLFKRAGPYVARILAGEKPGELPVQAPTKFELALNLKTAAALGLDIPPLLLARADEVIE